MAYSYNNWFKIIDKSAVLPVILNKRFAEQDNGKLTLEFRFKMSAAMAGVKWQLRGDELEGVSIVADNTHLSIETAGGQASILQPYSSGIEYGIKVVADIGANSADVYVNGALKASSAPFKQPLATLNNFQAQTGSGSMGELFFAPVKLYKGYVVNERFLSVTPGTLPGDWSAAGGGGAISVEEMVSSTRPDAFSLKLDAANASNDMSFSTSFTPQSDDLIFEYKMLIPKKRTGCRRN
ncbi:hypothetical protein [Cohnella faecalis]|uniref:Uncharacterized protein n=1 Tax=Cohnella faecalis TaxID=2315694 RepID=A0A398CJG5_9BACL|nr:hypothetical protein [Cohnella faecalis]RIE00978.1 hypothetical protein D3H35_25815 [Cohnella faecalis]